MFKVFEAVELNFLDLSYLRSFKVDLKLFYIGWMSAVYEKNIKVLCL